MSHPIGMSVLVLLAGLTVDTGVSRAVPVAPAASAAFRVSTGTTAFGSSSPEDFQWD
jgi:hypothetical protein